MYVDSITMKVQLSVGGCRFVERVYLHCVYNCGCGEEKSWVGVMDPLEFHTSVLVFIQLLCPTCSMMSDETSSGTHKTDCSDGWLEFSHVTGVPSHL